MEVWRRVLKIPRTEKLRNDEVSKTKKTNKSIWYTLNLKRKTRVGNLITNNPRITAIVEGKIEGKPERGTLRTPFMTRLMGDTVIETYRELKRTISDREKWREISLIV